MAQRVGRTTPSRPSTPSPSFYPTALTRWPLAVRGAAGPCGAPGGRRGGVPAAHLLTLLSQMQRGSGELQSTPTARSQPQPLPDRSTLHNALLTTDTGLGAAGGPRAALRSPRCPPPSSTIVRGRAPSRCRALPARRAGAWRGGGGTGDNVGGGSGSSCWQRSAPGPTQPPQPQLFLHVHFPFLFFFFFLSTPSFLHRPPPPRAASQPPLPPLPHPSLFLPSSSHRGAPGGAGDGVTARGAPTNPSVPPPTPPRSRTGIKTPLQKHSGATSVRGMLRAVSPHPCRNEAPNTVRFPPACRQGQHAALIGSTGGMGGVGGVPPRQVNELPSSSHPIPV